MKLRQPFEGDYPITLGFGKAVEGLYKSGGHKGIDYGCPSGTPILAAADGIVAVKSFENGGYGNYIIIRHDDGSGTVYAHLSAPLVNNGVAVKAGQRIGLSGNTGNSTGAHLHFECRTQWNKQSTAFDPMAVMQSVIDSQTADPAQSLKPMLVEAPDLPEEIEIICSTGAKLWDEGFAWADVRPTGTRLISTGKTIERGGYTFVQCYQPSALKWVAVHDEDTQILGPRTY